MPSGNLDFRTVCGRFVSVFMAFMSKRAMAAKRNRYNVLKLKSMLDGATCGLLLSILFWGSNLLLQCGDVELNPGPPKADTMRQTRLGSGTTPARSTDNPQTEGKEPTLADVMAVLSSMNLKFDDMKGDVKILSEGFARLQDEVKELREDCAFIRQENKDLKAKNERLEKTITEMDRKVDDLEGRSKRNNLIIHGLVRAEKETGEDCEGILTDLITDRLELADDFQFDRVHRLNAKPNSPVVARCTFFKDKVKILKAKRKLQGTNVFIGEDFSSRVRDVRRRLVPHLKKARSENKKCMMVFDHLIIDGKRFALNDGDNLKEMR